MSLTVSVVVAKLRKGEPISDGELSSAIPKLKELGKDLRELGPEFGLAAREVERMQRELEQMQWYRQTVR